MKKKEKDDFSKIIRKLPWLYESTLKEIKSLNIIETGIDTATN